jgi:hypothetical protein
MCEVETDLEINDSFADDTEPEMTRLDDPSVHWTNRNFVHASTTDRFEWKRSAIILKVIRWHGILA